MMNNVHLNLPSGWEIKKLGDVLGVLRNGVNCNQDKNRVGDKISRIESIANAVFDINKVGYAILSQTDKEKYRLEKGDILFSHINSSIHVGKTALFDCNDEVYHGVNLLLMRPKSFLNTNYFEHYLKFLFQNGYWKYLCKQSINQASVNQQDINKVEISYPTSLAEQERIVTILEEAFAAIAQAKNNAEQNLKNAKALFESYLQGIFENKGEGWEEKTLGTIVNQMMTGPFGSMLHQSDYVENGIPVVNPQNIVKGTIVPLSKTMVSELTSVKLNKYKLKEDDIVIARRGEMGRCAIVMKEHIGWLCGTGSLVIRANLKKVDVKFLNLYLSSSNVKESLEKASVGATMSNLNQNILSELKITLPPVAEQQNIVQKLDALSAETQRLATVYRQKLEDLESLKKAVLLKAFSGGFRGK